MLMGLKNGTNVRVWDDYMVLFATIGNSGHLQQSWALFGLFQFYQVPLERAYSAHSFTIGAQIQFFLNNWHSLRGILVWNEIQWKLFWGRYNHFCTVLLRDFIEKVNYESQQCMNQFEKDWGIKPKEKISKFSI